MQNKILLLVALLLGLSYYQVAQYQSPLQQTSQEKFQKGDIISFNNVVNIRKEPSGQILQKSSIGLQALILSEEPTLLNGYIWYHIKLINGQRGYSAYQSNWFQKKLSLQKGDQIISNQTINIRQTPSTSSQKKGQFKKDQISQFIGETPIINEGYIWINIEEGFIAYGNDWFSKIFEQEELTEEKLKLWVMGKYQPQSHPGYFTLIPSEYTVPIKGREYYFNTEAKDAFVEMSKAAAKDGVSIKAFSTLRNFDYQNRIWDRKYNSLKEKYNNNPEKIDRDILTYSAMPTTSRHHWGTDADINSVSTSYWEKGQGKIEYEWLQNNAYKYGFCQPYDSKDIRPIGYNEEKWHWSFMPVSKKLYEGYRDYVDYTDINGFQGSQAAEKIDVINNYVLSINEKCINFPIEDFLKFKKQ